jgi:hypothetical protein
VRTNSQYEEEYEFLTSPELLPSKGEQAETDLNDRFLELAKKNREVYYAKDSDYSDNGLPFGNVRSSVEVGVRPWQGVLLRMMDKRNRIQSFINKGSFKVADEKVMDTLMDLSNYSIFGAALYKEDFPGHGTAVHHFREIMRISLTAAALQSLTQNWSIPWGILVEHFADVCTIARNSPSADKDESHGKGLIKYGAPNANQKVPMHLVISGRLIDTVLVHPWEAESEDLMRVQLLHNKSMQIAMEGETVHSIRFQPNQWIQVDLDPMPTPVHLPGCECCVCAQPKRCCG